MGQSARLYRDEAFAAGHNVYAVDLTEFLLQEPVPGVFNEPHLLPNTFNEHKGPGTLVIHVNPPVFMLALRHLQELLPGKRVIAFWAWELMDIPRFWRRCLSFVNEVEVPSSFTAAALRRHTAKHVSVHAHAVPEIRTSSRRFAEDGIVRVLTMFDMASNFHRKNPLSAVEAFQLAFGRDSRAQLLIKTSSMNRYAPGKQALDRAVIGWDNIEIRDERLSSEALAELYGRSDIYLSLHRSEGYGLTIHEALRHGLHTVATGWSGNMDFMSPGRKCHPIPYRMVPVHDPQGGLFMRGQSWAEADTASAASCLQTIVAKERPNFVFSPSPELILPSSPLKASDVGVVLVNYRGWSDTLTCLASLVELRTPPRRVVVVDNGSGDSSVQHILEGWTALCRKTRQRDPTLCAVNTPAPPGHILLTLQENKGFAAGNNAALSLLLTDSGCRAFWLLNNDTSPEMDALEALCARLNARPDAGMAGSLLVNMDAPNIVQCAGGGRLSSWTGITTDMWRGAEAEYVAELIPEAVEQELSYLTAASLLARREVIEAAGLMVEDYFLYYEDVDWSLRVHKAGYSLAFSPSSVVRHREGGSSNQNRSLVDYLCLRNRLMLVRRFFPVYQPLAIGRLLVTAVKRLMSRQKKSLPYVIYALFDFITGRMRFYKTDSLK
ncbi:glycosyltransferase [Desulfocurvibacter africanus]|uniref:glycosyltransferase n=1 Tax=Desulfocurvibacter africanus TaxID=873 RepID=UPI00130513D8|nr:glycosyltransferase [Desulfocurvibacter africanus]